MKTKFLGTHYIVKVAILAAIATILMIFELPIPLMPIFLKIDLSELPVLIGGFALGPVAAILISLIKNLIHVFSTMTAGVGEAANFVVSIAFAVPACLIYLKDKSRKSAVIGLVVGSISMIAVATLANYFVMLPLYSRAFGWDVVMGMSQKGNENIVDFKSLIVLGIIPFNAIKVILNSVITLLVYKKLSPILHK